MYEEYLMHYGVQGMKWRKKKNTEVITPKSEYDEQRQKLKEYKKRVRKYKKDKKYYAKSQRIKKYFKLIGATRSYNNFLKKYSKKKVK